MNINNELFSRAQLSIPGGVNSPVRAFKSVGGTPVFFKSAKGAIMMGEDNRQYIDLINSWGPMIMGHAYPPVVEAIKLQAEKSSSFGAPTELETKMAELIKVMVPSVELIRMVNSGTEACMSAVRVARGYTGKKKILKFAGCYHGHADCFLIKAGSGALTMGKPNSDGVNPAVAADTLLAEFNDLDSVAQAFKEHGEDISAIIVEPVAGNMGCIPPEDGFLQGLRKICDQYGSLLIFDEVMTGFRLAAGGAQELYGVTSDLVTFGKIIGAGLPVGAFGGKKEIMECLAPIGGVYQAGTLSGNPIAMSAGFALLSHLNTHPEVYDHLDKSTLLIEEGIREKNKQCNIPLQINRKGSMISLHFCENEVYDFNSAANGDNRYFKEFFHHMLKEGIYLPPSAYESWFISSSLTEEHIDQITEAFGKFASNYR